MREERISLAVICVLCTLWWCTRIWSKINNGNKNVDLELFLFALSCMLYGVNVGYLLFVR